VGIKMEITVYEYEAIIEGLLFSAGDRLTLDKITEILDLDKKTVQRIINNMIHNFNNSKRGIMIREIDNGYQMCSKPEYFEYIKKLAQPRHRHNLSMAAYETLSIIAYKQPITRARIEEVRGVNSDGSVIGLLDRGLIKEAGNLDTPGKPRLYRTNQNFLRLFGFRTLNDLPKLEMNEILDIEDLEIKNSERLDINIIDEIGNEDIIERAE
jgi:segregation and condensation protein B